MYVKTCVDNLRRASGAVVIGLMALAGCAKSGPLRVCLEDDVRRPPRSVVIFFVDGMDVGKMHELLARGRLPNIHRRFVDGGVGVEHAVASIPAMTYPNAVTILTGTFPGRHNITGNQWLDRRTLQTPHYITALEYKAVNHHFTVPTLYEELPDHFSVNCLGTVIRGVHHDVDYHTTEGIGWFLGWYRQVDELAAGCVEDVAHLANRVKRWPSILVLYFPGVDQTAHEHGSDARVYEQALEAVDVQIGRVVDAVEKSVPGGTTSYVLVSDHGHVAVHSARVSDPVAWLRTQRGLKVHEGVLWGGDLADRLERLNRYDLEVIDGSSRRLMVYVRGDKGWMDTPTRVEVRALMSPGRDGLSLADLPGVALVCYSEDVDRVAIQAKDARAVVERRQDLGGPSYRLLYERGDPLEYLSDPAMRSFIEAGWHDSRAWLEATAHRAYPDFVPQIAEYFDAPRAGDLIVFAADGWVFRGHGRGEHGSARAEDMKVPIFFAGADLPRGATIPTARLTDVMPTVVDLLGERARLEKASQLDGESLLPRLMQATSGGSASFMSKADD
jgi:hypothetical protein